jgi:hypothetical protein
MRIGLRHPVGLGPSQGHADRRGAPQPDAEHDRHADSSRDGDALAFDHLRRLEPARQHDAVERGYRGDGAIRRRVTCRRRRNRERGGKGRHQQRRQPPEPHPGARDHAHDRQQHDPRPVVGGDRSESSGHADCRGQVQHPAGAADLGSNDAEQQPGDHRPGAEFPEEQVKHHHGQDNKHQCSAENVNHPPCAGRLAWDACRVHVICCLGHGCLSSLSACLAFRAAHLRARRSSIRLSVVRRRGAGRESRPRRAAARRVHTGLAILFAL